MSLNSSDNEDGYRETFALSKEKSKPKRKTGAVSGISEETLNVWRRGDDNMEPSTKMNQLIDYIREWDSSGDKLICYSQCKGSLDALSETILNTQLSAGTSMLDLVERLLASRHGLRCLKFDGRMNREQRDTTLAQFKKRDGPRIILIR